MSLPKGQDIRRRRRAALERRGRLQPMAAGDVSALSKGKEMIALGEELRRFAVSGRLDPRSINLFAATIIDDPGRLRRWQKMPDSQRIRMLQQFRKGLSK